MRALIPALLTGAALFAATPASACGGKAPSLTCSKSLALAKGIRRTFVASSTTPQTVRVPRGMFLSMAPPAGAPGSSCPVGPATGTLTLTATCTAPGTGATTTETLTLTPNAWNIGATPMTFPPGPPRICRIVGDVTSTCTTTTGTPITATARGDAQVCFVEPSPTDPSLPRLDLRQIDLDNELVDLDEVIARAHPGDPTTRWYRLTNHDDTAAVQVSLRVDSNQTAVYPDPGFPQPFATAAGVGLHSISDPGDADDFPIAFRPDLPCNDCVPLPDPLASIAPTLSDTIRLGPGESTIVSLSSRSWGMCADGSCGESNVFAEGVWNDGTQATACATGAHVADDTVMPTWEWDDSGATARFAPNPGGLDIALAPTPNDAWNLFSLLESDLVVGGQPIPPLAQPYGELINHDWGRMHDVRPLPQVPGGVDFVFEGFVQFLPG